MSPRWRTWLLCALVVLLVCGLLGSGAAHLAFHDHGHAGDSSPADECQACWLASTQPPSADGVGDRIHELIERLEDPACESWKSRRGFAAQARGPPAG